MSETSAEATVDRVKDRLDEVIDPCSAGNGTNLSIVEMGLLDTIDVDGGDVTVNIHLTSPGCMMIPYFMEEIERRVVALPGVDSVTVETDGGFQWHPDMMTEEAKRRKVEHLHELERDFGSEETAEVRLPDSM